MPLQRSEFFIPSNACYVIQEFHVYSFNNIIERNIFEVWLRDELKKINDTHFLDNLSDYFICAPEKFQSLRLSSKREDHFFYFIILLLHLNNLRISPPSQSNDCLITKVILISLF